MEKIPLRDLKGEDAGSIATVIADQLQRNLLLGRSHLVIGVDKDIRIEKTRNGHEFRLD